MAKKELTPDQRKYQAKVRQIEPKPRYLRHTFLAFFSGGLVCVFGQALIDLYSWGLNLPPEEAGNPAVATMIFIGALLTGVGVFDKLAKFAGAGLAVPVTGFANSVAASALEFREEGLIYGVSAKMFLLAGPVITFGVVTAFIIGLLYAIFQ